jgi:hypothetical protein
MLNDEDLTSISDSYSNIQWQSEEDPVEADAETPAVNAESPTEVAEQTVEAPAETGEQTIDVEISAVADETSEGATVENSATATSDKEKQEVKKKTYGDLRAELLKKFLDRVDRLIAKQQDGNNEN